MIVSVYAAGAVPGEFLPGARGAFLTSATFAVLALLATLALIRRRREPAGVSPEHGAAATAAGQCSSCAKPVTEVVREVRVSGTS